jgi:hypothetical protein
MEVSTGCAILPWGIMQIPYSKGKVSVLNLFSKDASSLYREK